MRRLTISLAAIALVGTAVSAHAQCAMDGPAKAKGMKASLIRSFAGCPSITFLAPNSSTGTGVPTCAPPYAHSTFLFDNKKGQCSFKTGAKLESPCKDGSGGDCMNLKIQAKCAGIVESDGVTPISGSGWSVSTVSRATLDDPDNGDMTVIDFPVQIAFGIAKKGKISVKTDTNTLLNGLGLAALPPCAQVEVVSLAVQDPGGNPFAKLGAGTRPKGL
jgi:hypothetical protein